MLLSIKFTCNKWKSERLSEATGFRIKCIRFLYKDSKPLVKNETIGSLFDTFLGNFAVFPLKKLKNDSLVAIKQSVQQL